MATTILVGPDTTDTLRYGDGATDSLRYAAETGEPGFDPARTIVDPTTGRARKAFEARSGETTTATVELRAGGVLVDTEGHDITWTATPVDPAVPPLTGQGVTVDGVTTLTFDVPDLGAAHPVMARLWIQVDEVHTWPTGGTSAGYLTLTIHPNV